MGFASNTKTSSKTPPHRLVAARKSAGVVFEDLQSWYGLSRLVLDTHDVSDAKTFVKKLQTVQSAHPDVGILASSVAALYSLTGDESNAMKYALVWQSHSINNIDKANAAAYDLSNLQKLVEQPPPLQRADGLIETEASPPTAIMLTRNRNEPLVSL